MAVPTLFPDEAYAVVLRLGPNNQPILSADSATATVYQDAAGAELAGITLPDGTAVAGGVLTLVGSRLPAFLDPAGRAVLYVRADGGPVQLVRSVDADRLTAVEGRVGTLTASLGGVMF